MLLIEESTGVAHPAVSELATLRGHMRALRGLSNALTQASDVVELFRATQRETVRALNAPIFFLALYDEASQTVEVVRQFESGMELAGGTFPIGGGLTSQVIRSRQAQLIRHWSLEGPPVQVQYASNTPGLPESAIIAPLLFGEQVLGVISASSYQPETFDDDDLLTLEVIAAQVAVGIANLRRSSHLDSQVQRRVSESEAIFARMADALLVVDAAGRIVRLNHAARKLLCVENTSIVFGQPLDREQWGQWPLGAQEVAETLAPMIEVLRRGQALDGIEVELRGQGRRFLSFSGTALFDPLGSVTGGLLVVRDITGPHEVERMKDEMLLIASHDLRLPVTVIKTQAQLLQRDIRHEFTDFDALDAGLVTIVGQADRLATLLSLLFDLSQIEAGRLEISPAPMDLRLLVASTIAGIQVMTDRHRVTFRAPHEVLGCWDERRLQQVVANLLINAVKYSPNGGPITLSIRTGKRSVTVRLRDPGVGLDTGEALHVFERFYRAKGIRQLEGTGLGLYICQGIVTAHGGRIWAESAGPGQGSTFCFTLPCRPSEPRGSIPSDV
ncbi:MAG TPA: ATP-binding protein [Chloroflexota bacterium]|nr:ATP-binding protein [Chloroflexota bacterium]